MEKKEQCVVMGDMEVGVSGLDDIPKLDHVRQIRITENGTLVLSDQAGSDVGNIRIFSPGRWDSLFGKGGYVCN